MSVAHVLGSPRVCGIDGADTTSITVTPTDDSCPLIDGGSNICITGDATLLVDAVDIPPVAISVALAGGPSSFDDTITKQGLLPLTLSDGTTYYQPCYFCANMVETIISPAAVFGLFGLVLLLDSSRVQGSGHPRQPRVHKSRWSVVDVI